MFPFKQQTDNIDADLKQLIKELGHKEIKYRDRAYRKIVARLSADPDVLNVLLSDMQRELIRVRREIYLGWLFFVLVVVFILLNVMEGKWNNVLQECMQLFFFSLGLAAPLSKSYRLKSLLSIVSNLDDKRLIGPLLQAQRYDEVRSATHNALLHLLPQLQNSDALLLTETERTLLYQSLNSTNTEYVLTALKALEQIGDSKALPYVEKLAYPVDKQLKKNDKKNETVMQAAQECLVFLQQRIEQQQISQSLLRASDKTTPAPDTLLRPASATQDAEPAQLLRATVNVQES